MSYVPERSEAEPVILKLGTYAGYVADPEVDLVSVASDVFRHLGDGRAARPTATTRTRKVTKYMPSIRPTTGPSRKKWKKAFGRSSHESAPGLDLWWKRTPHTLS